MLCESVYRNQKDLNGQVGELLRRWAVPGVPHPTSKQYHVKVTCTVRFSPSRRDRGFSCPNTLMGPHRPHLKRERVGVLFSLMPPKPPPPLPQVQVEGFVSPPTVYTLLLDVRHPAPASASPSLSPAPAPPCVPLPSAPLAAAWCVCAPGPCICAIAPPRCFCAPSPLICTPTPHTSALPPAFACVPGSPPLPECEQRGLFFVLFR